MIIEIAGTKLQLLKEKSIWFPEDQILLISDIHLGKANHFRKHGLAVPHLMNKSDLWRLSGLLGKLPVKKLIFLGDLFHSKLNLAWPEFGDFLENYPKLEVILIKGNHDIIPLEEFSRFNIAVLDELKIDGILLTHDRVETDLYNLHGHIHPAVKMEGSGRQYLKSPCFFFSKNYGILPSFGEMTGSFTLKAKKEDQIFIPLKDKVVQVN